MQVLVAKVLEVLPVDSQALVDQVASQVQVDLVLLTMTAQLLRRLTKCSPRISLVWSLHLHVNA